MTHKCNCHYCLSNNYLTTYCIHTVCLTDPHYQANTIQKKLAYQYCSKGVNQWHLPECTGTSYINPWCMREGYNAIYNNYYYYCVNIILIIILWQLFYSLREVNTILKNFLRAQNQSRYYGRHKILIHGSIKFQH